MYITQYIIIQQKADM